MRLSSGNSWAAAILVAFLSGTKAADTSVYHDAETGFTFTQYMGAYDIGKNIAFRIAVPSPVTPNSSYDTVLQVVVPIDVVGWVGLAWGGSMLNDPLTVFWVNGRTPVISSRYTSSRSLPPAYTGASYQLLRTGTHTNATHWQFTAKCSGCTAYQSGSTRTVLSTTGANRLAFAYAAAKPANPASNTSSFGAHDVFAYWSHDFASAGNTAFASLVAKNL